MKFKLFGRLMKKKPTGPPAQGPGAVQHDRRDPHMLIDELKDHGMPEAEIIKALKEEGYSFNEIDNALNETLRSEVTGEPRGGGYGMPQGQGGGFQDMEGEGMDEFGGPMQGAPGAPQQNFQDQYLNEDLMNRENQDFDASQRPMQFMDSSGMAPDMMGGGPQAGLSMPEEGQPSSGGAAFDDSQRENVYEIVESVVNERIGVVHAEIKEINEQIKSIQQIISDFKTEFHDSNEAHIKEMGSTHDKIKDNMARVSEIEPRVAGVERAFKDIVPNLVDSVREVKEIVNDHLGEDVDAHMKRSKEHEEEDIFSAPRPKERKEDISDDNSHKEATERHKNIELPEFDESDDDERI